MPRAQQCFSIKFNNALVHHLIQNGCQSAAYIILASLLKTTRKKLSFLYFVACFPFQTQPGGSSKTLGPLWSDGRWVHANSWDSDRDECTSPFPRHLISMLILVPLVIQNLKCRVSLKLSGEAVLLVYLGPQSPTLQLPFILHSRRLALINSHCCCFCRDFIFSAVWIHVSV